MIRDILTDPLLIIGAAVAAFVNWIAQWASPVVGLVAGVLGLVVLVLTIMQKVKEIQKINLEIKEKEEHKS